MGFYDNSENIDKYIDMCTEYDGTLLYSELEKFLSKGSSLLELGSGPGFDLDYLSSIYRVIASDLSEEFIKRLKIKFHNIPVLKLNATNINLHQKFDCIFSNKVLHHLTREELELSLNSQFINLNPKGIIAHTFWLGSEDQEIEGLLFKYYRESELTEIVSKKFNVLSKVCYREFEDSDSLFIIAQVK